MIVFPNIKINLGLYITDKRGDGFHNLISCFYPVGWTDILEITLSDTFEYLQSGIPIPGAQADNLCVKAYNLLQREYKIGPVRIHLHKIIPMGAGLGGGSSDAAFTLRSLDTLFSLKLTSDTLEKYAAELGSDCAFFIKNVPAIASSRGEVLKETNPVLKGKFILIVCPDIHVSTKQAFTGVQPKPTLLNIENTISDCSSWKQNLYNQFEDTVFPLSAEFEIIKGMLYEKGAFYASMSGSGSAIYGIFDQYPDFEIEKYRYFKGVL